MEFQFFVSAFMFKKHFNKLLLFNMLVNKNPKVNYKGILAVKVLEFLYAVFRKFCVTCAFNF